MSEPLNFKKHLNDGPPAIRARNRNRKFFAISSYVSIRPLRRGRFMAQRRAQLPLEPMRA